MTRWTTTELATLVREYPQAKRLDALGRLIPRHSLAGIYAKARRCGLALLRGKKA
ncbi:hypothetical protein [Ralstonia sp. 3PA37C10]|jgi:hypothetical protein|uniref:hypothetical protein n=1 Tax=unclassified Ralstonia TaxID=209769 RepID=UPI0014858A8E|nr:hypothetical protein [Ralstonia sp. 3PA37C10]